MPLGTVGAHIIKCPGLHPLAAHKLPLALPQGAIADVAEKDKLVERGLRHVEGDFLSLGQRGERRADREGRWS